MALIKCPECGKDVSDKAEICVNCGYPIKEYVAELKEKEEEEKSKITICPACGQVVGENEDYCPECGRRITPYVKVQQNKDIVQSEPVHEFHGIYKYTLFGGKQEVYCPRCGSENCSFYNTQRVIPGKTKTRYTANLNPLHPFTLVNKKEKVVRKDMTVTDKGFMCNDCGKIFY